jgi:hypothetical protein
LEFKKLFSTPTKSNIWSALAPVMLKHGLIPKINISLSPETLALLELLLEVEELAVVSKRLLAMSYIFTRMPVVLAELL